MQARQLAWLGTPSLSLALPITAVTIAAVLLLAAAAALVVFGSYARRIDLHGLMLPQSGLIKVSAPSAGWIQSMAVADGQDVNEGAVLYRLNVDTMTGSGATQQTIIQALNAQRVALDDQIVRKTRLRDAQDKTLQAKIANLKSQIAQTQVQIDTQAEFEQALSTEYHEFADTKERGLITRDELDLRQQRWMSTKSQLEDTKGSALRLQAQLTDAEHQLATNDPQARNDIDSLRGDISKIDQQIANSESHRSIEIHAPGSGTVTAVIGHPGQLVAAGGALLTIVPRESSMQAQLAAPSSAIGFLRAGERVLLRYSAFPYQKFGQYWGTVMDVSHAALPQEEVKQLLASSSPLADQALYRVTVQPDQQELSIDNHPQRLTASMGVEVFVLLDSRPLYQWILEPLYGLRRNFQAN